MWFWMALDWVLSKLISHLFKKLTPEIKQKVWTNFLLLFSQDQLFGQKRTDVLRSELLATIRRRAAGELRQPHRPPRFGQLNPGLGLVRWRCRSCCIPSLPWHSVRPPDELNPSGARGCCSCISRPSRASFGPECWRVCSSWRWRSRRPSARCRSSMARLAPPVKLLFFIVSKERVSNPWPVWLIVFSSFSYRHELGLSHGVFSSGPHFSMFGEPGRGGREFPGWKIQFFSPPCHPGRGKFWLFLLPTLPWQGKFWLFSRHGGELGHFGEELGHLARNLYILRDKTRPSGAKFY